MNQEPRDYESPALTVELWTPHQSIHLPLPALKLNPTLRMFADPFQGLGTAAGDLYVQTGEPLHKVETIAELILSFYELIIILKL